MSYHTSSVYVPSHCKAPWSQLPHYWAHSHLIGQQGHDGVLPTAAAVYMLLHMRSWSALVQYINPNSNKAVYFVLKSAELTYYLRSKETIGLIDSCAKQLTEQCNWWATKTVRHFNYKGLVSYISPRIVFPYPYISNEPLCHCVRR